MLLSFHWRHIYGWNVGAELHQSSHAELWCCVDEKHRKWNARRESVSGWIWRSHPVIKRWSVRPEGSKRPIHSSILPSARQSFQRALPRRTLNLCFSRLLVHEHLFTWRIARHSFIRPLAQTRKVNTSLLGIGVRSRRTVRFVGEGGGWKNFSITCWAIAGFGGRKRKRRTRRYRKCWINIVLSV